MTRVCAGLDAHKKSIVIGLAFAGGGEPELRDGLLIHALD